MRSFWHPAPKSLEGVIDGIWSVSAPSGGDLAARVLPDTTTCLVFQRDGTVLRTNDGGGRLWRGAGVSGPRTCSFDFTLGAAGGIFIVPLLPVGAAVTLRVSMSTLADTAEQLMSRALAEYRF